MPASTVSGVVAVPSSAKDWYFSVVDCVS